MKPLGDKRVMSTPQTTTRSSSPTSSPSSVLRTLQRHGNFWRLMAINAVQKTFVNRWSNALFMLGKTIRLGLALTFLWLLRSQIKGFAGYTPDEMMIFFLTYQFIDSFVQMLYRGVYNFSSNVKTGDFDFSLAHPISPLFRSLLGHPDINDLIFIFPTTFLSIYLASQLQLTITAVSLFWYGVLLVNSLVIATALHIFVLSAGILFTQIEQAIWIYRDLNRLGQFPVTIYFEILRFSLFFIVPIGFMVTVPAQVLLNAPPTYSIGVTTLIGATFFISSILVWKWSLKRYSSASS